MWLLAVTTYKYVACNVIAYDILYRMCDNNLNSSTTFNALKTNRPVTASARPN